MGIVKTMILDIDWEFRHETFITLNKRVTEKFKFKNFWKFEKSNGHTVGFSIDFQKKEEGFLDEYCVELCSEKLNPRDLTIFLG